jgi:diacylglycerol kinase (ATP)
MNDKTHPDKSKGLKHVLEAIPPTIAGFKAAYRNEEAIRQEVVVFAVLIPAAFWLGNSAVQVVLLVGCCLLVFAMEIVNGAIETMVDRIGLEFHELSGRAKDLGSAAVYVCWFNLVITWVVIGADHFFHLF